MAAGGTTLNAQLASISNANLDALTAQTWVPPPGALNAKVGQSNLSHLLRPKVGEANLDAVIANQRFRRKQDAYFNELKGQYEGLSRNRERIFNVEHIDLFRVAELMGYGMWRLRTSPAYLAISTEKPKLNDIIIQFLTRIVNIKSILKRVIDHIEEKKKEYALYLYDGLLEVLENKYRTMAGGKKTYTTMKKLNKRRRKYTRK